MKKLFKMLPLMAVLTFVLAACSQEEPNEVEARATFELSHVAINEEEVDLSATPYAGSRLTFVGEEQGGNVLIQVGDFPLIQASINPSREHPSFETGYWHHHLYAGSTEAGSERINFMELLPELGIDDNPEATDNTQSNYQRGNLHYVVEEGQYRLRFTIDGETHDLFFTEV